MIKRKVLIFILIGFCNYISYSQEKIDSIVNQISQLKDNQEKIESYLSFFERHKNDNTIAQTYFVIKIAQKLSRKLNYERGLLQSIRAEGEYYFLRNEYDSATFYFNRILKNNLIKNDDDKADILNFLGVSYQHKGEMENALSNLNSSLDIYRKIGDKKGILKSLVNIGNCFYETGNAKQALLYNEEAYKLALEIQDAENLPITMLNYAMLSLYVEKDFEKVDKLLSDLSQNKIVLKTPTILSTFYQNLAVFLFQTEEFKNAEVFYNKAWQYSEGNNLKVNAGILTGLANIQFNEKNNKKAVSFLRKALSNADKISEKGLIYKKLAQNYTQLKNIDSASYYWEQNLITTEQIQTEKIENLNLRTKSQLDIIQKENQIKHLEEKNKIFQLQKTRNLFLIIILSLLTLVVIIVFYSKNKQKEKLLKIKNLSIELKNQKLVSLSLKINQKNQIIADFDKSLNSTESSVSNIKKSLKKSMKIDKDWEEFEIYFNDLNDGFYEKLKSKYPKLTNNELRICSLSKLRFSLKEIANMLSISNNSVKSSRYRIRKKLNINTNEDLSDFLNNL